jgi:hypothetical protein
VVNKIRRRKDTKSRTPKQKVLGRTNRVLSYDMTRRPIVAAGTSSPSCDLATIGGYTHIPRHMRPTVFLLLSVSVAAGTCLPSLFLATMGWIHIQTHGSMGGIYEVRR